MTHMSQDPGAWIPGWSNCTSHLAQTLGADCCFIVELPASLNLALETRQVCSCGHIQQCAGHLMDDPLILETIHEARLVHQDEALFDHPYNRIIPDHDHVGFIAVHIKSMGDGAGYVFGLLNKTPWKDPEQVVQQLEGMAFYAAQLLSSKSDAFEADLFFQISNDALLRVGSDGTISKINQRGEKLTGYKHAELCQQHFSVLFPGLASDDLFKLSCECYPTLSREGCGTSESPSSKRSQHSVKLRMKAGSLKMTELMISGLIPNRSGSNDLIITLRDKSAHEKLESMVKQVSDFSNEILSIVGAYVFVLDADGRIVLFNNECERITGEYFEEVVGQPLWEIIPEALSHRQELEKYRQDVSHFSGATSHKSYWTDKDGKRHHIQWRYSVIKDADKHLKYLIGCGLDVTEQDASRKIIERDGKLLQQFIRYVPAAVAMFDSNFQYLEASLRWKEKFGISEADHYVGRDPSELHGGLGIFENWSIAIHECLHGHHKKSNRDTFIRQDGQEEIIRWEMQPWFDEESRPGGVIIFAEIITELVESEKSKRSLERQLYRTQKLEAIGTLAGGVAHDFNNILAGIVGFTELLKIEFSNHPFANELTGEVLKATDRAKMLVKQILAFSRNQEQTKSPASLTPIVTEVAKMIRATCPSHIKVTANASGEIPFVFCDQNQIHQVVVNMCTNGVHAMEETTSGGHLSLNLECIHIEKQEASTIHKMKTGTYLKLTIKDTGMGMDDATLQRIFDPFFTTKEAGRGTGLGLSVAHGIIKSHGGHIRVASKKGIGTTFDIYLPAITEAQSVCPGESSSSLPQGRGERIMFVDNEQTICQSTKIGLEKMGYTVEVFTDPSLAYRRMTEAPDAFDVVITDLDMPRITGIELARKVKSVKPDIPVVLCSGFISEKLRQSNSMNLFVNVLAKPNKLSDLCFTLKRIFAARQEKSGLDAKDSVPNADPLNGMN